MKTLLNILPILLLSMVLLACEDENGLPYTSTSLKVFHGIVDGPNVHVNYFGRDITFANNPTLGFGGNQKYTLRADVDRDIRIVNAEDTLSQLLSSTVSLPVGGIGTLFLTGRVPNIEGLFLADDILTLTDSLVGVRFINLSPDSSPISIDITAGTENLVGDLAFKEVSSYLELAATSDTGSYSFEFKDNGGDVIASYTLNPLQRRSETVFKNLTLALIGLTDDGNGGNTLVVKQINNF